ncbi:hypothetical protein LZ645_11555 [Shewanella algae]|uniref:hypothetical protein n=1 Tax=Shewanella algae TaxID=38313 RepID=UPI001183B042|nr:hypothetical protein [Shewanella algae]MCE9775580.1 hypothetical protein [Shewanella algae]TVK95374.1 hypothetical protein AYJ01_00880 [Shewanella algae]
MIPDWLTSRAESFQRDFGGLVIPSYENHSVSSLAPGPKVLQYSGGNVISAVWMARVDGTELILCVAEQGEWSQDIHLGILSKKVSNIDLAFDQTGNAVVSLGYDDGEVGIFWYNPETEANEERAICPGSFPVVGMDNLRNTGRQDTELALFYVDNGTLYRRKQQDRWEVAYPEPVTQQGLELLDAGMVINNRYQVKYRYLLPDYRPPTPQPPTQPDQPGSWSYFLNGYQSVIDFRADMLQLNTEFSIGIQLDSVELDKPDIALWSHQIAQVEGYYGGMMAVSFTGQSHNVVRVLYGGRVFESLAPFQLQPGHWLSEVTTEPTGTYLTVSVKPSGQSGYISHRVKVSPNYESSEYSSLKIGAMSGTRGRMINCLRGSISAVTVVTPTYASGLKLAMDHNSYPETGLPGELQPILNTDGSPSGMDNAIIRDYRPQNWAFNPD